MDFGHRVARISVIEAIVLAYRSSWLRVQAMGPSPLCMTNGETSPLSKEKDSLVRWMLDFTCDLGSHSSYREERGRKKDLNKT